MVGSAPSGGPGNGFRKTQLICGQLMARRFDIAGA